MQVGEPVLQATAEGVRYEVPVATSDGPDRLWFSAEGEHAAWVLSRADAALAALLVPSMARGDDLIVEGVVTDVLVHNLPRLQELLRSIMPSLHRVRVGGFQTAPPEPNGEAVVTGFSAGIDSFAAVADHAPASCAPPSHQISHLLFNNVGSHGRGADRLFEDRYYRALPVASELGLPLLAVNSNLDDHYGNWIGFTQTHTIRNSAVALLLQLGIRRFYYGSSHPYRRIGVGPTRFMGKIDPILLPLLSTPTTALEAIGSEYTRVEKSLRVAELPPSYTGLDVCTRINGRGNCSSCAKCLRTLAAFEIADVLDRYGRAFDLDTYQRHRTWHFAQVAAGSDDFLAELRQFAAEREFQLPLPARLAAPVTLVVKWVRRIKGRLYLKIRR